MNKMENKPKTNKENSHQCITELKNNRKEQTILNHITD